MGITDHTIQWQGMAVSIRHVANWSGTGIDHIEVRSITPERAPLPITETGYCSHFLHREDLSCYGGAVAFVTKWLDHEARSGAAGASSGILATVLLLRPVAFPPKRRDSTRVRLPGTPARARTGS